MKRYMTYERAVQGIKGSSLDAKLVGVNAAHEAIGLLPPFSTAPMASAYLKELKSQDAPPAQRVAVCPRVTQLYALTHDVCDSRVRQNITAQQVGRRWCLRSKEYLAKTKGSKPDQQALKWKDVLFRTLEGDRLQGKDVIKARKITLSVMSNKNKLARCTRTTRIVESDALDPVKMLIFEYNEILVRTGSPPADESFVFELADEPGKFLSREEVSGTIQELLSSLGVPKHLAGSHSLRRGGATVMHSVGVPDEEIKRWGRWTSDAYKLYITLEMDALEQWTDALPTASPCYEYN